MIYCCPVGRRGTTTSDGSPIQWPIKEERLRRKLAVPSQGRLYYIRYAFKMGWSIAQVNALTTSKRSEHTGQHHAREDGGADDEHSL